MTILNNKEDLQKRAVIWHKLASYGGNIGLAGISSALHWVRTQDLFRLEQL
jgi:hypothetical protein